jgi:hypothetical protein
MMLTRRRSAATTAFLIGVTISCSDAPSAPSDRPPPGVSSAIAQTIAVAFGTYFPGAPPVQLPAACPYSAAAGTFACAPAAMGALTYTLSYALLDAGGRSLDAPDGRAVAMRTVIDLRGRRGATADAAGVVTDVVARHEILVSGLQSAARTFSGTAASHYETGANAASAPRTVQDVVGATMNVVFDTGARWPRSGTITTSEVTTLFTPGAMAPTTSRSHAVVEFDGTSVVTVSTSADTFTLRCRFDLDGRVATTCS